VSTQQFVAPGSAAPDLVPKTPRGLPNRGGARNPSAERIRARFASAFVRAEVVWGDTNVYVSPQSVLDVVTYLHTDDAEQYDYLVDVTAVEFRDLEIPIQVVWHLRSLPYRRFLRLKAELPRTAPLHVPSVWPVYRSADWLERECFDMFGIRFEHHPDLRRILLEDGWEGHPLLKSYAVDTPHPPFR
jgi:NADH-quinone oxidoreductase subunit C